MGNRAIASWIPVVCRRRIRIRAGVVVAVVALALATALLFPAASGVALAQSGYDEADAQRIDRMLMCPVCPAQTIDQTEVTQARQMRAKVRELLADGASRSEILDWFRQRYGPGIVAEPPRSGINLIAWILPGVVIILALVGGVFVLRAMRRRPDDDIAVVANAGTDSVSDNEPDDLQPWLAAVDRDLALPGPTDKDDTNG